MTDELRRKDDQRYEELSSAIGRLMSEVSENQAVLYDKNGVFETLHQHTNKIESINKKLDGLHLKLDAFPKVSKKFIAGAGATFWAILELVKYFEEIVKHFKP